MLASRPLHSLCASTLDESMRQLVAAELRARQRRLGTAQERPEDFHTVRELAHLLNNRRTVETLTAGLAAVEVPRS